MSKVLWSPQAREELKEIASFIATRDNRQRTAKKIVREIHGKADFYASQPDIGVDASHLGEGLKYFVHKRWLIFYQLVEEGIAIVRVIDGSRDYDKLLDLK